MGRMDRTAVRKLDMNSPDFEEENMMIFHGTPAECWRVMRDVNRQAMYLGGGEFDVDAPLRRDIAAKFFRNQNN